MTRAEIISELNELDWEWDNLGFTLIDVAIDDRADNDLPPFTPEELSAVLEECNKNKDRETEIASRMDDLREQYFQITGHYPRHRGRYVD